MVHPVMVGGMGLTSGTFTVAVVEQAPFEIVTQWVPTVETVVDGVLAPLLHR
jgi:hypothetical protein